MVDGFLHEPSAITRNQGVVLAHGAGSDCNSPLLRAVADTFSEAGFHVLRINLTYRQLRPTGPPIPGQAGRDREGLAEAARAMRAIAPGHVILSGHSYGGRQSSMLLAEDPTLAEGLLLLSYPLHPPRKPEQLRTAHLTQLKTPSLFIHGTRDPFGTIEELREALAPMPAQHGLIAIEKAGHEMGAAQAPVILRETLRFFFST